MTSVSLVLSGIISHKYQIVMTESKAYGWNTQRVKRMTGPCGSISTVVTVYPSCTDGPGIWEMTEK